MTLLETRLVPTEYGSVRIAERTGSSDAPALVFVHGYPDNLQIWSRLFDELETDRRLIALDWPGLGHSQAYIGGATPFHLGRHFLALIDALELDQVVPVGFDMGAHAVVAATARAPERVAQLVLTNFLADGTVKTSWDIAVMRKLGLNRLVLRYGARVVFERALRTFLTGAVPMSADVRRDMWDGFRRSETRTHLRRMCAGYQAGLPRLTALYPSLDVNTLVVWADEDDHFPLAQANAVADALPDAELHILEGASHWLMWEQAPELARLIESFLAS